MNEDRIAFEAWAKREGYDLTLTTDKLTLSIYTDNDTDEAFCGFRAARALAQPAAQPVAQTRTEALKAALLGYDIFINSKTAEAVLSQVYAAPQPAQEGQALSDEQIEEIARELFCKGMDDKEGAWGPNTLGQRWLNDIAFPFARALLAASLTHKKD